MAEDRQQLVFMAKLAEQSERYDEMKEGMMQIVELGPQLTLEEREMLSIAYKHCVGTRRTSSRIIAAMEEKDANKKDPDSLEKIREYRVKVDEELKFLCEEIIRLLDMKLIPNAADEENLVYYNKMKGDYFRYLAECLPEPDRSKYAESSRASYQTASEIAEKLSPTNPTRLGLALNYTVLQFEVLKQTEEACKLAKKAFDDAIEQVDSLDEAHYKESSTIIQLLRDNLTTWTADMHVSTADE